DKREKQGGVGRHGALAAGYIPRRCACQEEHWARLLDLAVLPGGVKGRVARHGYREIPLPPFRRPLPIRLAKHKRVRWEDPWVLIVASLGKPHRCRHHKSEDDHDACHYASPKLPATFHWNPPFD